MTKRTLFILCIVSGGALCLFEFRSSPPKLLDPRPQPPLAVGSPSLNSEALAQVAAAPSPSIQLENPTVRGLIHQLAEQLGKRGTNFADRDQQLRAQLQRTSTGELHALGLEIAQGHLGGNDARVTLYLLGLAGEKAVPALREIALGDGVAATSEIAGRFALSLRMDALEQLDILAAGSREAQAALLETASKIENRGLKELARIAAFGVQQGSPGKLHRLMDESLKSHGG